MFIEVSFGQDMTQLFNTNVTNNILLDYIKNAVRAQMVEELGGKENLAKSTIDELSQDLERTENINGKAENPEDDSDAVKELKQSIEKWTQYLKTSVSPYLKILNMKGMSIDLMDESGSVVDLSSKPKVCCKEILSPKQKVQLVYKIAEGEGEAGTDYQPLKYNLKDPYETEKELQSQADTSAADGA
jgi:hypothetical protein